MTESESKMIEAVNNLTEQLQILNKNMSIDNLSKTMTISPKPTAFEMLLQRLSAIANKH